MASQRYFSPALFEFLTELKAHNTREWFARNKDRYETSVRGPMLDFIADLGSRLRRLSPHVIADPSGVCPAATAPTIRWPTTSGSRPTM